LKQELELDEQPKTTRKISHPATPISNKEGENGKLDK
jgi:hypothetical protein